MEGLVPPDEVGRRGPREDLSVGQEWQVRGRRWPGQGWQGAGNWWRHQGECSNSPVDRPGLVLLGGETGSTPCPERSCPASQCLSYVGFPGV